MDEDKVRTKLGLHKYKFLHIKVKAMNNLRDNKRAKQVN